MTEEQSLEGIVDAAEESEAGGSSHHRDVEEDSQASEGLEPVICFDTFGTTMDFDAADFNRVFFEKAQEIDTSSEGLETITEERLAGWRKQYATNQKDPGFLRETGPYKAAFVRQGFYSAAYFDDVLEFFARAARAGFSLVTVSKGGIDLLTELYGRKLPQSMEVNGRPRATYGDFLDEIISTSGKDFRHQDKTDPETYLELAEKMRRQRKKIACYVSDDKAEVEASKKADITSILIPPDDHKRHDAAHYRQQDGLYMTNNLPDVVAIAGKA